MTNDFNSKTSVNDNIAKTKQEINTEINLKEELIKFFSSYEGNFQIYYIKRGDKVEGKYIYSSYYCIMGKKLNKDFSDDYRKILFEIIEGKETTEFDIESEKGDTIEVLNSDEVCELGSIKEKLDEFHSNRASQTDFNIKDIWGCAIVFINKNDEKLSLFRKYTIPKSLQETKKLRLPKLKNKKEDEGELELLQDEIISLDLKIDSFEFSGRTFVLSKYYFHQFFNYREAYVKFVDDSLEMMRKTDVIDNFDDFCLRCKESFNLTKTMVKVIKENRLNWVKSNINSVVKVINEYGLKVEVNTNENKITYTNKCKIKDFMDLICGRCVRDAIDSQKGIASSVKKLKKH